MAKFVMSIDLDETTTQDDIARAVLALGKNLRTYSKVRIPEVGDNGLVRNDNWARIGGWHVED